LAIGTLPIGALGILDINTDADPRVTRDAVQVRTISDARHVERAVGPDEPERWDVRETLGVQRRQLRPDVAREQLLDLVRVKSAWWFEH
jgi:hypothetical protein